jgi:hypothetical protein
MTTNTEHLHITDVLHVNKSTPLSVYSNFNIKQKIHKSQDVNREDHMTARTLLCADSTTLTKCI